jgi:hypothetical protein
MTKNPMNEKAEELYNSFSIAPDHHSAVEFLADALTDTRNQAIREAAEVAEDKYVSLPGLRFGVNIANAIRKLIEENA